MYDMEAKDMAPTPWVTDQTCGYDNASIGRYTVIVWTGSPAVDLDSGHQVMECYIPTTDRQCPDGRIVVGRRRLGTRSRQVARDQAIQIATKAITELEARS